MVRLTRIYTRGGDQGKTSLSDGRRVDKHDARVAAYGEVDEANAAIGLARLHCPPEIDVLLASIQNDLFDLGADLATPGEAPGALRIVDAQVTRRAERAITALAVHEPVNPVAVKYVNRLSDHLFVLSRTLNDHGRGDVLWRPGANRGA
jgi:cob(I)alamin adenosyltransferase